MAVALYREAKKPTDRFVLRLIDYWKETPVKQMTSGAIQQSAITLYPNASGATRNRQVIKVTQAIINHAAEQALCQHIRVKRFPVETKAKIPADWTWVQAFQSAASPHLGALACFMFLTGARISEALSLTWTDVDLGTGAALIRQTKIGSERRAHLPLPLLRALENIPGPREGRVFRMQGEPLQAWNNAIKRAGIKKLSFHSMRHGFATELLRANVNIIDVARLGGWRSPAHVFATYGHATDDPTLTDRLTGETEGTE